MTLANLMKIKIDKLSFGPILRAWCLKQSERMP